MSDAITEKRNAELLDLDTAGSILLGSALRALREARKLSQIEVAKAALGFSVSHAAVSRAERGMPAYLKRDVVEALATFYGTDISALVESSKYVPGKPAADAPDTSRVEHFELGVFPVAPGFGARLLDARRNAKASRKQLCDKLGWGDHAQQLVRMYEQETQHPRRGTLTRIALVLGVPAAWLITGKRMTPQAPSKSLRTLALRYSKGLSRTDLAQAAFPDEGILGYRKAVHLEGKGAMAPQDMVKIAHALDVPVEWLDPRLSRVSDGEGPGAGGGKTVSTEAANLWEREQALPPMVRKLIEDLRTLAENDLLNNDMAGSIRKAMFSGQLQRKKAA